MLDYHSRMGWLRHMFAFLLAVVVAAALGAVASTHFVLASLAGLHIELPFGERLSAYGHDVVGMGPTLAMVVAVGFAIAFPIAALGGRVLPRWRKFGHPMAGAAAMLAALALMEAGLGMMPVAGARTTAGLAAQGVAGAVGGYVLAAIAGKGRAGR